MSEATDPAPAPRRNPLMWIALVVIGLILFVFLNGDRRDPVSSGDTENAIVELDPADAAGDLDAAVEDPDLVEGESTAGTIQRALLVPPGMRAREYISQLRAAGKPYPLSEVYDKAQTYRMEGSLADAHLLYFFAARENHLPAMMMMAEMADPGKFRAEDSLLDQADLVQAYKWYRKAADLGQVDAAARLESLRDWAADAAASGNSEARQFLLNFQ